MTSLVELWPPFALVVRCGPLELRPIRDDDFPEVLAVVHGGIHDPAAMPFYVPWTDATGTEMERQFLTYHWRNRVDMTPKSWSLPDGVSRLARGGELALNQRLVLRPEDLVRPSYDVEASGLEQLRAFLEIDQVRAT